MKQKQYCTELTAMSGIAIMFVLGIHCCGSALSVFHADTVRYADATLLLRIISNLVSPAVPMFLFVAGYKYSLNDSQTPYFFFLKKRLPRVLVSFAIINTLFWVLDAVKYMQSFDVILLIKTYLHSWVGYSVAYQLWYIPMYCFVLALCPLVRRIIPSCVLRFCIYAAVGILQRILEADVPILATYPIRFISYPVFFELGVLAQETGWKDKLARPVSQLASVLYVLMIILMSWITPAFSTNGLVIYLVYYFGGIAVFYILSIHWKHSHFLQWMGALSYPVFLLHEPLIGKAVTKVLSLLSLHSTLFILCWLLLVFALTWLAIVVLTRLKCNKILWDFHIPNKKK